VKVGDLVKLKGDDIRGSGRSRQWGQWPIIPAGTVGIVVFSPHAEHYPARPFVKLCGIEGAARPFLSLDLEVINESR